MCHFETYDQIMHIMQETEREKSRITDINQVKQV